MDCLFRSKSTFAGSLLFLGFAIAQLCAQSPWTRPAGGFFVQAAWQTIPKYSAVFESANEPTLQPDREISEHTFQLYGEYGLDAHTTLSAALPLRYLENGARVADRYPSAQTSKGWIAGLGNVSFAVKRALLTKKLRLAATLRIDAPTNFSEESLGLRTGYHTWTILPTLSAGMGWGKVYWQGHAGYGLRTGGYSHLLNGGGEVGIKAWKCWLIGFSEIVYSLENGDVALPLPNRIQNIFVDKQGWWSLGGKIIFEVKRSWGITASFGGAAWAQRVPKSPSLSVGAYVNMY